MEDETVRFATIVVDGTEQAALACHLGRRAPLHRLDPTLAGDLPRQHAAPRMLMPAASG